jgi:hypothetical protein
MSTVLAVAEQEVAKNPLTEKDVAAAVKRPNSVTKTRARRKKENRLGKVSPPFYISHF